MNYYLKIHFFLIVFTLFIGIFYSKNKKVLLLILFPGSIIIFSSPFVLILIYYLQKDYDKLKELKYETFYLPEEKIIKNINQTIKIDNDLIFYTYREKLFPENHSLYFLKNLGRSNNVESQIISSSTISHKEELLLKNIKKTSKEYETKKNVKKLISLCNSYFNYCYFGYATENLRKYYTRKACTLMLEFMEENDDEYNEIYFLLGKFYLNDGMYREAKMWFGKLMISDTPNANTISYLAEIFFYEGEYKKMIDILSWLSKERELNEKLKEVVGFWEL
ncbi:MAG: hypothetical protein M0R46_01230 [Candidatus Muirbacterium halophilum]|nr:hypothetical protein [Candidatus Muirbacterium halophilum]MCK9474517.1 hypothetical protein [Candidatus Muirbacterium halophilum]